MGYNIEEKFYKTFGIKRRCCNCNFRNQEEVCNRVPKYCQDYKYPKITSDILLELICIENDWDFGQYESANVKDLKNEVLEDLISYNNAIGDNGNEELKAQVQSLFKGGVSRDV